MSTSVPELKLRPTPAWLWPS